jgi:hypothetical protein
LTKKSVENVKRNLGIDTVFAMSLEEFYEYAKERGLKFDVITFFEVLEHQDKTKGISGNGKRAFGGRRIHSWKRAKQGAFICRSRSFRLPPLTTF